MASTRRYEQNPEIISKSEKFVFSANFVSKLSFHKNRGKICLTQWKKGFDKLHKGYKNFEFFHQTFSIPHPREYANSTNWRHWNGIPGRPGIHLLVKLLSLAHFWLDGGWILEGCPIGYPTHSLSTLQPPVGYPSSLLKCCRPIVRGSCARFLTS